MDNNTINQTPYNPNEEPNQVVTSDQNQSFKGHTFTKIVTGLLVIVVIGGLVTYIQLHHANQPSTPVAVQGDEVPFKNSATVSIQNQQVMPSTIKVSTQTDISFENHDSVDYHIDSNQTTNSKTFDLSSNGKVYSYIETAFANNVLLPAKGGYSYVFAIPGTYYYHDVNNANINGEIIVN